MAISVRNFTRQPLPRLPFEEAARTILPDWEISLAFAGERRAQALNRALRGKRYVPNVLSYQAGEKSGEIVICLTAAAREASDFALSPRAFTLLLFIHGLLHLKGASHGVTMERRERALMARFLDTPLSSRSARILPSSSNGPTYRNRHRHRHLPGEARRRRGHH